MILMCTAVPLKTEWMSGGAFNQVAKRDYHCLADNIYHEARNQPHSGKVAVAFVTLNRVKSGLYPSTVCGVVHQKTKTCQFSWVCGRHAKKENEAYKDALYIARIVLHGYESYLKDPTHGALFYHANYVKPVWRHKLEQTIQIADHIFYKPR